MYLISKRKAHELLDVLLVLVLLLDAYWGVQHVPDVGKSSFNQFLFKN